MKLTNEEKKWAVKGFGWLGAIAVFALSDGGLLGFLPAMLVWLSSLLVIDALRLGKEND